MSTRIAELVKIMARLRSPDGCPWDREQTHESLKPYLLEESYETLEAIDSKNPSALKEELGDVLLQVIFHAQIAEEHSEFTLEDVATHLGQKLVRRHPHVFHPEQHSEVKTANDVAHKWEAIKSQERPSQSDRPSALDGIPNIAPALQRAYQVQKRASKSGFDWKTAAPVLEKLREECDELYVAASHLLTQTSSPISPDLLNHQQSLIEDEFGDVLFSFVNMARFLKINPEESLRKTTNRFITRFQYVEAKASENDRTIKQCSESDLERWWEEAKSLENHREKDNPGSA